MIIDWHREDNILLKAQTSIYDEVFANHATHSDLKKKKFTWHSVCSTNIG